MVEIDTGMGSPIEEERTLKSATTLIETIETIQEMGGATVTELADEMGTSKSTVHRHKETLKQNEYVVSENGTIHLGLKFLRIGDHVRYRTDVSKTAEDIVETLAEDTEERANFFVEEWGYSTCLHRETGSRGVIAETKLGKRFPMHATAAGKAMLSEMSREQVLRIIDRRGLAPVTEHTIVDETELFEELETVRETGIAINNEECLENLRAVGAPVTDSAGEVLGALTVSAPVHRFPDSLLESELKEVLKGAADEMELRITHPE